jgi:sugar phosphate isomerase/epimerase
MRKFPVVPLAFGYDTQIRDCVDSRWEIAMSMIYVQPRIWKSGGIAEHAEYCFKDFLNFANEHGCNLELGTFAYANALDSNWRSLVRSHQHALSTFKGKVSVHGVFQDICIHSNDSKIAKVSKQRIRRNMDIAQSLSAKYVVFHANFNPFVYGDLYRSNWIARNADFWREILDSYEATVLLENFWESSPEIFNALLKEVNMPRLRVCLDTGHINAFSKVPMEEWVAKLENQIPYMHFSDNTGKSDQHLQIGNGNINWQVLTVALKKHNVNPEVVLETETIKKTDESLRYLETNKIYPFKI